MTDQPTNRPNPERIGLWAEALESERYRQGRGALYHKRLTRAALALLSGKFSQYSGALRNPCGGDCYCCLGVMCEIYRLDTGKGRWHGVRFDAGNGQKCWTTMPRPVAEWYGFNDQDPVLSVDSELGAASQHNDGYKPDKDEPMHLAIAVERKTFQQIGAALLRLAGWSEITIETMMAHAQILMSSNAQDSKPVFSLEWAPGSLMLPEAQSADAVVRFCNVGLEESDHA